MVAAGKVIIPFEKITLFNSLESAPENKYFFQKSGFFSDIKQKNVSEEDYENSKILYLTLKMTNLNDMNDLYNVQDVILLCKITEKRF